MKYLKGTMEGVTYRFQAVPFTREHLAACGALWGDRIAHTSDELAYTLNKVDWLLSHDRARGRVIVDEGGTVRGFGLSVFVHEGFAARFLASPYPQIGKRLLLHPDLPRLVLDEREVATRNADGGLQLVVLNQGFDTARIGPDGRQPLAGTSMQCFFELHRGFNLARIINEAFGDEAVAVLESVQPATIYRFSLPTQTDAMLAAGTWTLSREEAERQAGLILPMFTYHRPYLQFSASERRVLQAALDGSTDATIAATLGLSVHAVKATWTRVLRRIAEKDGLLCSRIGALRGDGPRRGAQVRHLIVEYVRHNPSELTPYAHQPEAVPGRASIQRA